MKYQIHIHNRNYSSWEIVDTDISPEIANPFEQKLFDQDTFEIETINESSISIPKIILYESPIRNQKKIAGILILEKNKSYGRTPNKKRLYYTCIPFQKNIPTFLIPYEIQIGFNKSIPDKYVLFQFDHWNEEDKHPYGLLTEVLGNVTDLNAFYEYQLHGKYVAVSSNSLNKSIREKLQKRNLHEIMKTEILSNPPKYGEIESRENSQTPIFTIDPEGCKDRDDALSIQSTESSHIFIVSVHITNIWIWIAFFHLFDFLQETNISTIYLPHRNVPMFPTELSEKIASLDIDHPCFAITMDFLVDIEKGTIERIGISQTYICIHLNFNYDSKSLMKYTPYKTLLQITQKVQVDIHDSHTLVAFWMVKMNTEMARELQRMQTGVFRIAQNLSPNSDKNINPEKNENIFYYIWENAISGKYVEYSSETNYYHEILDVPIYTHFTSPIRRMVDVYNQIVWVYKFHLEKGNLVQTLADFFKKYSMGDFLVKCNKDTKTIRKIQTECQLLHLFRDKISQTAESFLVCEGVVILIEILPLLEKQRITVYLPEYKCILSCKDEYKNLYMYRQKIDCKLFLFEKKDDFRKKIKLVFISK